MRDCEAFVIAPHIPADNPATPPIAPEPTPLSAPAAPLQERERITAIDALRGFALLGILILNIQSFAMPGAAYLNPTAYGDLSGGNFWVWYLSHVLGDQKFMTIFSMLFGAGIVLMATRLEQSGKEPVAIHYRRMAWLILFGILHAHLIWYGDILYFYGMCGLVAYWFRKLPPLPLIVLGVIAVAVPFVMWIGVGLTMQNWPENVVAGFREEWMPPQSALDAEIAAYQGGWMQQMYVRVPSALSFEIMIFLIWGAWRAGGLMLIGMALFKMGVFSATRSSRFYLTWIALAVLVGMPITMFGVYRNFAESWSVEYSFFLGSQFNYVGSILVSLGWVGALMLILKAGIMQCLLRGLQAVGRMALTNYLLQSIICTLIFYGHGLGKFGEVERTGQLAIVVGVWIVQLTVSPLWLRYFQFGPMEWLWRTLSYWRLQPVRRETGAVLMR